jgi:hypothetical protein
LTGRQQRNQRIEQVGGIVGEGIVDRIRHRDEQHMAERGHVHGNGRTARVAAVEKDGSAASFVSSARYMVAVTG